MLVIATHGYILTFRCPVQWTLAVEMLLCPLNCVVELAGLLSEDSGN